MKIYRPVFATPRRVDARPSRVSRPTIWGTFTVPLRRTPLPHLAVDRVSPSPVEDTAIVSLNCFRFLLHTLAPRPLRRLGVMIGAANGVEKARRNDFCFPQRNIPPLTAKGLSFSDFELVFARRVSDWYLAALVLFGRVFASGFFGFGFIGFVFGFFECGFCVWVCAA